MKMATVGAVVVVAAAMMVMAVTATPPSRDPSPLCQINQGQYSWDLNPLQRGAPFAIPGHIISDPNDYMYTMNFCMNFPKVGCPILGSVYQEDDDDPTTPDCKVCGNFTQNHVHIKPLLQTDLTKGINYTLTGGDLYKSGSCAGVPRKTEFLLQCDCYADDVTLPARLSFIDESPCGPYLFSGRTRAACPVGYCQPRPPNPVPEQKWCQFVGPSGTSYDLNKLRHDNGYSVYNAKDAGDDTVYQYRLNICGYVKDGCGTFNESVVQMPQVMPVGQVKCKDCGTHSPDTILLEMPDGTGLRMQYLYGDIYKSKPYCMGLERTTKIHLICDCNGPSGPAGMKFDYLSQETIECEYEFWAKTKLACRPGACHGSSKSDDKKLSGGWIFIIILICVSVAYFLGGFIFKSVAKGTRGLDSCPNPGFWSNFYGLVADGIYFVAHGCQPRVYSSMHEGGAAATTGVGGATAASSGAAATSGSRSHTYGSL